MSCSSQMDHAAQLVWGPFEPIVRTLYMDQDLSLAEVMHEMATKYQFNATKSQYELQLKKWQFRKNCTADEWKIVAQKFTERQKKGKETEVILFGNQINPKKLKRETRRYGSTSSAIDGPAPPTPPGIIIRTPSPILTRSISLPTELSYVNPLLNVGPAPMDCLPFHQFFSVFGHAGNPFLHISRNFSSDEVALPQDIHSSILKSLTGRDGKEVHGSLSEALKALLPQNFVFSCTPTASDMAISQRQPFSAQQFLELTIYLVSNNFFGFTSDCSIELYKWINRRSNTGLMENLLSIGGPTVESLTENLFRLAIDADDDRTVKRMMKLGVDPNEQVYRNMQGDCHTPLLQACRMQSLKLVKALINGGAKVDPSGGNGVPELLLTSAVYGFDECGKILKDVDPELVRVLIDAGASMRTGLRQSPLAGAVQRGNVEVVDLLVSAGANLNDAYRVFPLYEAVVCEDSIPDADVISMVQILLNAGADPQPISWIPGNYQTALEGAMRRKSIDLIQLLLQNGARVTQLSFVLAVRYCDINIVKVLLRCGGQVTESVIESAIEYNSTLLFFLLETTDEKRKKSCQNSALIKSIGCRKMDLVHRLRACGAQLENGSMLQQAIQEVVKVGDIDVLRFLLEEISGLPISHLELPVALLSTAIKSGWNDVAELLLMSGAEVNGGCLEDCPLLAAIKKRDLHFTKQLLAAGAAVNGRPSNGSMWERASILPAAVDWGHFTLIQDIINAGADIDAPRSVDHKTALFVAVEKKDMKAIKLLIDAGADVNSPRAARYGQTALAAASRNNDLQMVHYLLRLGADPNDWPLKAAISGSLELVRTLLAARLHRYHRYSKSYGCIALQKAITLASAEMIQVLLGGGIDANVIVHENFGCESGEDFRDVSDENFRDVSDEDSPPYSVWPGMSAFGHAIMVDKTEDSWIVKMVLRGGGDPKSIVTLDRRTALLVAIAENSLGIVKLLITEGADVNPSLRSGSQRTPLQLAAEKGRIEILNILLDSGADVNAPPFIRYGATALQFAAIGGYIGIAQRLISKGADVNAPPANIAGRTALEGAAEHGRIDMLQLLLSAGAQVTGPGLAQYDRARELALMNGHRAACRLLENYSADMFVNFAQCDDAGIDFTFS